MHIPLFPYERRVLESLEAKFSLDRELVVRLALSLRMLCELFECVVLPGEASFRQGRVVVAGLINHSQHLLVGGLAALDQDNGHVWSLCVRGLIETLGACVMVGDQPGTAANFLNDRVKAGRLRAAAERARPGLGRDLDRLNNIVHPASRAILAGFRVVEPSSRKTEFAYGLRQSDTDEGREGVAVLANLADEICAKLAPLTATSAVLCAGSIVMERADNKTNGDA